MLENQVEKKNVREIYFKGNDPFFFGLLRAFIVTITLKKDHCRKNFFRIASEGIFTLNVIHS